MTDDTNVKPDITHGWPPPVPVSQLFKFNDDGTPDLSKPPDTPEGVQMLAELREAEIIYAADVNAGRFWVVDGRSVLLKQFDEGYVVAVYGVQPRKIKSFLVAVDLDTDDLDRLVAALEALRGRPLDGTTP